MKSLRGTAIVIGGTIGAGFISGAELVRFFHTRSFLVPVLVSSLLFVLFSALLLSVGRRHGGYDAAMRALFKRGAPFLEWTIALASLVPCAGMLAGLDALLPACRPLLSLTGLGLSYLVLRRGTRGISAVNFLLVPVLLCFVFWSGRGEKAFFYPVGGGDGWGGAVLYASLNAFLLLPVLLDAGADVPHPFLASALAGVLIAAGAATILGCIYREGAGALGAEMPFLYVMRGKKVFSAAVALAIFTSLAASLFPLLQTVRDVPGKKKYAAEGGVLLAAFLFSRLGLTDIVTYLYPAEGVLGLVLVSLCVLNEYFFEKNNKKVHPGGEQAQDRGGAHDEVEFEHLSAVNDEVAKPRL